MKQNDPKNHTAFNDYIALLFLSAQKFLSTFQSTSSLRLEARSANQLQGQPSFRRTGFHAFCNHASPHQPLSLSEYMAICSGKKL